MKVYHEARTIPNFLHIKVDKDVFLLQEIIDFLFVDRFLYVMNTEQRSYINKTVVTVKVARQYLMVTQTDGQTQIISSSQPFWLAS